jgi:hypothetical protein
MSKPHTYIGDLSHLPKALHRLLTQCRFVVWRWKKCAASLMAQSYGRSRRIAVPILASRPSAIGIAAAPAPTAARATNAQSGAAWPQIIIRPGELPRVVNEAESALLQLGREIYQRGGLMVRPVLNKLKASNDRDMVGWQLAPVTLPYIAEAFTCAAQFLRFDHRSKKFAAVDAPKRVAETYLVRQGVWRLPILTGITNTPFLRHVGSLCEQPGYDQSTGLLFKPDGQTFPTIAPTPTKADATAALARLDTLLKGFPFVGPADRAVALSAILTMLDRRAMATAPLHAFTAPAAGTGKSLLVDVAAMLSTGRPMPVISQGKNEEELEKRLASALLAGDAGISIDNCEYTLQGGFLCQALTQPMLNIRLLGYSRKVATPVNAALYATGNNLEIAGDLIRRCLLCSMDAGVERPELRLFSENVVEQTLIKRGELVGAALTMLRAWHIASAKAGLTPLGGFEEWSHRIRDALVWLGCADPCETMGKIRGGDPERAALVMIVEQWRVHLVTGQKYTIQEVIGRAVNISTFYTALMNVAASKSGGVVSNDRLGRWLKRVEGKIVNGLRFLQEGSRQGYPCWTLR